MDSIGAYDAKTHFSSLLRRVASGETVAITRHGREIARLVPGQGGRQSPTTVINAIRAARVGVRRGSDTVREMIDEGRR